jgi:Ca-activated chloride channel family protein
VPTTGGAPSAFASASEGVAPAPAADAVSAAARPALAEEKLAEPAKGKERARNDATLAAERDEAPASFADANLDWGATVYLSNDDSMSLASAQRALFAVQNGRALSPAEIRPHELLNYFSFDTVPVPAGDTFSVTGSARRVGDEVQLALAVRGASVERQPLDLSVVVDRSGSMSAEGRMAYTRRALDKMVDQLVPGDRVDLVLFDDQVCSPLQNFVVGRDDLGLLRREIARMEPRGSTDLDAGLREAYRQQSARDSADVYGRNRRILLLTDAYLNTGNVNQDLVSEVGKRFEQDGIRLTGVGVGRDFNDKMLDQLTEKGKGAYVYLGSEAVVDRLFGVGFASLVQTLAHDVRFSLDLPETLAMRRFYGEESSTNPEEVQPINYYDGTTQLFLQDLTASGAVSPRDPLVFHAEWRDARTGEPARQQIRTTLGALLDADPHNLDKARTLMGFSDVLLARSMSGGGCGAALDAYVERRRVAGQDAELDFVDGLVSRACGVDLARVSAPGVAFKVRVDSDVTIAEVGLVCGAVQQRSALTGSDTVASFSTPPGACEVRLQGAVEMRAPVEVSSVGGQVRCVVRGGRVSCS